MSRCKLMSCTAIHLVRSMKNMAAHQLNPRHQHGPLACLLRILRSSLDQMKGVPYGLTPKQGQLTTGCLATGCGQLAWQLVARHNRLPTSGLATGCPPQPVAQIPFDTIWAPPVAELIAWFSTGGQAAGAVKYPIHQSYSPTLFNCIIVTHSQL